MGFAAEEISKLLQKLPYRWYGPGYQEGNSDEVYAELAKQYPGEKFSKIFADATALLGIPDHLSIHPGGVVIAPGPMTDLVAVQLAPKGIVITQFDLVSVERLGMLKIDLLGIRGLTVLGDVAEGISASTIGVLQNGGAENKHLVLEGEGNNLHILEAISQSDPLTSAHDPGGKDDWLFSN